MFGQSLVSSPDARPAPQAAVTYCSSLAHIRHHQSLPTNKFLIASHIIRRDPHNAQTIVPIVRQIIFDSYPSSAAVMVSSKVS